MTQAHRRVVNAAGEGIVDEAVARRLIGEVAAEIGLVRSWGGRDALHSRIPKLNRAAERQAWLVLVDLDRNACAPSLCAAWLPQPAAGMCLRVAVRAVESWLLADRARMASHLGVVERLIPLEPDRLENPKLTLVNLARRSCRRELRSDMAPRPGSGRAVGPAYASRLIEFIDNHWVPTEASQRSPSLAACRRALLRVVRESQPP